MTDPTSTIWLTQEAFDKLRNEYQHLIGPGRQEVTAKIARARDEGDLSETIKQVWASLWNFRAFEERDFYRIDHFKAAMGVLVHPNFDDEKANGVAITRNIYDPNWPGLYVNAQVGEALITNPTGAKPDEFLIARQGTAHAVCDAKVHHARHADGREHDVPGFEVAMDDPTRVCGRNGMTDVHHDPRCFSRCQGAFAAQSLSKSFASDVFKHQASLATIFKRVMQGGYIGMRQPADQAYLIHECGHLRPMFSR